MYKVCTTRDYFLDREAGVEDEGMECRACGRDIGRRLDLREFCGLCLLAVVFGCIHARAGPYRSRPVHTREVAAAKVTRAYQGYSAAGEYGRRAMDLDCEPCTIYDKTTPTARKPTLCQACSETIPAGVKYTRVGILFDGRWDTVKRCQRCEAIHAHLVGLRGRGANWGSEWPNDRLDCGYSYKEVHDCEPPDEIAALAFALPGDT